MKKTAVALAVCLLVTCAAAFADGTVEPPKSCEKCGMDRTMFAHSRMIVEYGDGTTVGVCSIHCAAADMKQQGAKQVTSLKVADFTTKVLTDARTAAWVVGGKKKGVMTAVPKWAFADEKNAQAFVKEDGGNVTPFEEVLKAASAEPPRGKAKGDGKATHVGN
jgi:nitrous oxide reductase accessory protein NosL